MSLALGGFTGVNLVIGGFGEASASEADRPAVPTNVTFVWRNWLDDATLVASHTQAGSSVENLKKQKRKKAWVTPVNASGPFYETLTIDLGEEKFVTFFGLVEHNLPAEATIRIQGNTSAVFTGTTPYDETIQAAETVIGYGEGGFGQGGYGGYLPAIEGKAQPPRNHFMGYDVDGNLPFFQYWKLTITVPDLESIDHIEIGRIFMGEYFESLLNFLYGFEQQIVDPSTIDDSLGDSDVENAKDIYSEISMKISNIGDSELHYSFFDFYYNIGIKRNFILMLDPSTASGRWNQSFYGRFADRMTRTGDFYNQNSLSLRFKEIVT